MSQATAAIANMSRTLYRGAVNAVTQAIQSLNGGATAPTETYPNMWFADTANDLLKQRNTANSAWLTIGKLSTFGLASVQMQASTSAVTANAGTVYTATQSPAIAGAVVVDAIINAGNGGAASTLNVNGGGAYAMKQYDTTGAKINATVYAGQRATFMLDATPHWILMTPAPLPATIANAAVTAPKLSGAQTGSAPVFGIRAWVNFSISGGVCTILDSGNVASVGYVALGNYRITFTQALNNANYGITGTCKALAVNQTLIVCISTGVAPTSAGCDVYTTSGWADGLAAAAFKEAATVSLIFIG